MPDLALPIRTLIVDDEPLARRWIRKLLADEPDFELIGECGDGPQAIETMRKDLPDLVFLDIQMPGMNGFGVLSALEKEILPAVVFVTAYDQYAIDAFKFHALEYLLKPFSEERFREVLLHIRETLQNKKSQGISSRLQSLLEEIKQAQSSLAQSLAGERPPSEESGIDRLAIKSGGKISFLKVNEIHWIEAAGDYLEIHHAGGNSMIRGKIGEIEKKLNPRQFMRVHRSTIVNIDQIKELQPLFHGDYQIILHDKAQITLSRNYRDKLASLLNKSL